MKQEYFFHFHDGQWWRVADKEVAELKHSFLHLYYEVDLSASSLAPKQKEKLDSIGDFTPVDNEVLDSIVERNSNSSVLLKMEISDSTDQNYIRQLPIKLDIPQYLNDTSKYEELLNGDRNTCIENHTQFLSVLSSHLEKLTNRFVPDFVTVGNLIKDIKLEGEYSDVVLANRCDELKNMVTSEDIPALLERSRELAEKISMLQIQGKQYEDQKKKLDSPEVRVLLKECSCVEQEIKAIKDNLYLQIETPGNMQVLIVKDNGIYKEIARETNKERFYTSVDFDNLVKDKKFTEKYGGSQFLVFEIDPKEYLSIDGISTEAEIIEKRNKLLTEKGQIKYSQKIVAEERKVKKPKPSKLSKDQQALNEVAQRDNRNVFDGMFDFLKMGFFIVKDILIKRKKEDSSAIQVPKIDKELIQVIVMEKEDGVMTEIRVERNPNLFLLDNELGAFAERLKTAPGVTFRLLEIPVKDYPDVNKYLEKGIMTEEGKEKFQTAKSVCFQKQLKRGGQIAETTIKNKQGTEDGKLIKNVQQPKEFKKSTKLKNIISFKTGNSNRNRMKQ